MAAPASRPRPGRPGMLLAIGRPFGSIFLTGRPANEQSIPPAPPGRSPGSTPGQSEHAMYFEPSAKVQDLQKRVSAFMAEHVYPNEKTFLDDPRRLPPAADADRRGAQ